MKQETKEYFFLHVARLFGCLGVIALHSVGLSQPLLSDTSSWWTKTIVDALSIWAVPLFVMISGSLLLNSKIHESAQGFYKKRLSRIGIPALFWIPFYFLVYHFYRGDSLDILYLAKRILYSSVDHLYFLILIFQLYLLTPLFRRIIQKMNDKHFFGLILFFSYLCIFWKRSSFVGVMFVPFIHYYFLGGYLLRKKVAKQFIPYLGALFIFTTAVLVFATYYLTLQNPGYASNMFLYSPSHPLILVVTVLIFLLIQNSQVSVFFTKHFSIQRLRKWSHATFGIYILHPLILYMTVTVMKLLGQPTPFSWYITLMLIPFVSICSYLLTQCIQSNRLLKRLL